MASVDTLKYGRFSPYSRSACDSTGTYAGARKGAMGCYTHILLFATEYGLGLASATSRKRFLLSPWRQVDAATILIPLVTLLPGATRLLLSSPGLRLARLARVTALGARATGVTIREESATAFRPR